MIKLYGVIRSRSNRPHWALEELEVPYEFYQLDFSKGDNKSNFFLNLNPAGKMPVLEDGELVLTESGAICNYLGEKYPEKQLIPKDPVARARYDEWMFFLQTELEQPLWTSGKHRFALPEERRLQNIEGLVHWEFERAALLFSQRLADRDYLLDQFSIVDIVAAHTLRWARGFKFPINHANLENYLERMEQRPAFQRMLETKTHEIPR